MACRVLLADDHQIVRQGLKSLLAREDVVVLDVAMPLLNGLDAAREILQAAPRTGVVLLTMHAEDHQVLRALRLGVRGYVIKRMMEETRQDDGRCFETFRRINVSACR